MIVNKEKGFTLIEIIVFIVVTGLLMATLLIGMNTALRQSSQVHQEFLGLQAAKACMEWLLVQRQLKGYATYGCSSTPSTANCPALSGYTLSASVTCTTWNSDPTYKTITVTVSGLASVSLSTQIGNF